MPANLTKKETPTARSMINGVMWLFVGQRIGQGYCHLRELEAS